MRAAQPSQPESALSLGASAGVAVASNATARGRAPRTPPCRCAAPPPTRRARAGRAPGACGVKRARSGGSMTSLRQHHRPARRWRMPSFAGEIEVMGDVRGGILRRALALARGGVRSPRETRLRLLLSRAACRRPRWPGTCSTIGGRSSRSSIWPFPLSSRGRVRRPRGALPCATPTGGRPFAAWVGTTSWLITSGAAGSARAMVRDALQRAGWTPALPPQARRGRGVHILLPGSAVKHR
jgi:hypothetical protein